MMKKMKKKVETAEVIKAESAAQKSDAGIFSELLKQTPMGWRNLGISAFVRKHFKQFSFVREKFYSWKQIAAIVEAELHSGSRDLPHSLRSAFFRERHRGEL